MAEEVSNKSLYVLVILIVALVIINAILIASAITGSAVKTIDLKGGTNGRSSGAIMGASVVVEVLPAENNLNENTEVNNEK